MTTPTETLIGRWRELHGLSRPASAERAGKALPTWLRFEREERDYLRLARRLFGAIGAALLVIPPGSGAADVEDQALLGAGRLRVLYGLIETVVEQDHPTLGSTPLRQALARALVAAALQVAAPRATSTLEQGAELARALRTHRYSLGFDGENGNQ